MPASSTAGRRRGSLPASWVSSLRPLAHVLLLALLPGGDLVAQQGALAGRVTADDGRPLTSVRVRAIPSDGGRVEEATTDADGRYEIADLAPGRYTVEFALPGWEEARRAGFRIRRGTTATLSVALSPRPYALNPLTVTGGRREERLLDAPASISVLGSREVEERPALTLLDHVEGVVGTDVIRTGLENGYVVTRGFNGLLNGNLLLLIDHRIARVPSFRANLPRVVPVSSPDIERIELVRGPASALYGPDAADGVLHVLTKSPIDHPGLTVSVAGGAREQDAVPGFEASTEGVVQVEGRAAARFGDRFGAKLSGRFFRGTDWRHLDPVEEGSRQTAEACLSAFSVENPACQVFSPLPGALPDTVDLRRVGARDFVVGHWTLDGRADWRPRRGVSVVGSAGIEWTENSLDQAEPGTAQTVDGVTWYGQARLDAGDLFAQAYVVKNRVVDGFLLATGQSVRDRSAFLAGQVQHSLQPAPRQRFIYGLDVLGTIPATSESLHGIHEQDDEFGQVGAYLQSETALGERFDLVLAARADHHTVLEGLVLSPRAALVFEPTAGHHLRATFNRAFLTPAANQLFLDVFALRIPLGGPFGYGVRVQGPAHRGFRFERIAGRPAMKSPFAPLAGADPADFLPATTAQLYVLVRELLRASGSPAADLLDAVGVPSEDEVSVVPMLLNPGAGQFEPLPGGLSAVRDLPPLEEQVTNTLEVGYKGLLAERLLISADLYYTRKENFLGPPLVESPNLFLDGEQLVAFFTSRGVDEATARALAIGTAEEPGISRIPLGVVQPANLSDPLPNLFLTTRNFGDVAVFGADLAVDWRLRGPWSLGLAGSVASDDRFDADGLEVALNAPAFKAGGWVAYRDDEAGANGRLRYRFVDGYPARSGVFAGRVDAFQLVDLTLGYALPVASDLTLQLSVENLFDEAYRAFPGAPELGRFVLGRVVYGL